MNYRDLQVAAGDGNFQHRVRQAAFVKAIAIMKTNNPGAGLLNFAKHTIAGTAFLDDVCRCVLTSPTVMAASNLEAVSDADLQTIVDGIAEAYGTALPTAATTA